MFTYYPSSKSELSFVGANGETLKADSEHVTTDKVSSYTDFITVLNAAFVHPAGIAMMIVASLYQELYRLCPL